MQRSICILLFIFLTSIAFSEELIFAIGEWRPYTTEGDAGLATEIVSAACKAADIQYKIIHVPWLRAESYVEKGEAFATFPHVRTKERQEKYAFTDPIFKSSNTILYNVDNTKIDISKITDISYFKNFKVGINAGSDALVVPLRNIGIEVETTEDIDLSLKKLKAKRIDFIIEDKYVIQSLMNRFQDPSIVEIRNKGFLFEEREYCLMITKKNANSAKYIEQINRGIQILRSNGQYQKIIDKY